MDTPEADERLDRLAAAEPELMAAIQHAAARGDAARGLDIANTLGAIWTAPGSMQGQAATFDDLRRQFDQPDVDRRRAESMLWGAAIHGRSSLGAAERATVGALLDEARRLADRLDDGALTLLTCVFEFLSWPALRDIGRVSRALEEGLELATKTGDEWWQARFELWCAMAAHLQGNLDGADALARRALARSRSTGDSRSLIRAAIVLRTLPGEHRNLDGVPDGDQLVALARATRDRRSLIWLFPAVVTTGTNNPEAASALVLEGLQLLGTDIDWATFGVYVLCLVVLAADTGPPELGAELYGMLTSVLPHLDEVLPAVNREMYRRAVGSLEEQLGSVDFRAACQHGEAIEDRHRFALDAARAGAGRRTMTEAPSPPPPLTTRELEVLRLMAAGMTNKEIAAGLGIRPKTIMHHSASIYRKLEVRGRCEATAWAHRSGIVGSSSAVGAAPDTW
jgi:DNA-binding CsgD family transcriptional regulator